jgi:uncharacterized protein (TIGR03067 family)
MADDGGSCVSTEIDPMRRLMPLFAALSVFPLLGSDSPKEYDDAAEANNIQGMWQLTEFEFKGAKAKPDVHGVLTYRSGTSTLTYGNVESLRGSYRIDPTQKPPHIDWIPSTDELKGRPIRCIYRIDGDTLKLGFMQGSDWSRPQRFYGEGVAVETYKRVK